MKTINQKFNIIINNNSLIKKTLIGLSLSSFIITQSMSDGILPVTNWNLYPIQKEVTSVSI